MSKLKNKVITTKTFNTVIYCGPTIKGVVKQDTHYCNGLPKKLKELSDINVNVKRLIVPIEQLVEVKKNLDSVGSIEYVSFQNITKGV